MVQNWRLVLATGFSLALAACGSAEEGPPAAAPEPAAPEPAQEPELAPAESSAVAARLARFLWDDPAAAPEITLTDNSAAAIEQAARTMLADSRARSGVAAFADWWLRSEFLTIIDKGPEVVSDVLRADLRSEIRETVTSRVFEGSGNFAALVLSPTTFVNESLAAHYGISGVSGAAFREVPYGSERRLGVFTSAAALSIFASPGIALSWPPKRGWLVNQALTCTQPLESFLPSTEPAPDRPIRQQLLELTAGNCQGCHKFLDPPGLAFIPFDGLGRELESDLGFPFDSSGHLPQLAGNPQYVDVVDMLQQLAAAPEVHRCFAQHVLRYALDPEGNMALGIPPAELSETLDVITEDFVAAELDLQALFVRVASSNAFRAAQSFDWDQPAP